MNRFRRLLIFGFMALALTPVVAKNKKSGLPAPAATGAFAWENAIVSINVTTKEYSYQQPWVRSERMVTKCGVVAANHQIITTADDLADATLVRVQKQGNGSFAIGHIAWIDYQSNLAAIVPDDATFWVGTQVAKLADPTPISGPARVLHWEGGELDNRQADVAYYTVSNSALSFVSVPVIRVNANVPGAGYGEAITVEDKLIGLASQSDNDTIDAVPSNFITSILQSRANKSYTGLGYFDFTWDTINNPLNATFLKLPGPTRGVIIKDTGLKPGLVSVVKPRDILLSIDGFAIDSQGNYIDPQYKRLVLENLSSRGKWSGAACKFKIWRDGAEREITYVLPKAEYSDELVPSQSFDQSPEYVIVGGFVFTPLTQAFLRSWGSNWHQTAPFRLAYYLNGKVKPDRLQRVVLSQVLPDNVNLGYEGLRHTVIDSINGMPIRQISDIPTALQNPQNGFDVFTFAAGEPIGQAVLDATAVYAANQRILTSFHIARDQVLNHPMTIITGMQPPPPKSNL